MRTWSVVSLNAPLLFTRPIQCACLRYCYERLKEAIKHFSIHHVSVASTLNITFVLSLVLWLVLEEVKLPSSIFSLIIQTSPTTAATLPRFSSEFSIRLLFSDQNVFIVARWHCVLFVIKKNCQTRDFFLLLFQHVSDLAFLSSLLLLLFNCSDVLLILLAKIETSTSTGIAAALNVCVLTRRSWVVTWEERIQWTTIEKVF